MSLAQAKEPLWLGKIREAARARFDSLPVPGNKDELFKFTAVSDLDWGRLPTASSKSESIPEALRTRDAEENGLLCFSNGELAHADVKMLAQGVSFTDLRAAFSDNPDFLETKMLTTKTPQVWASDKFAALAESRWTNGIFLSVAENTKVEGVLRATHFLGAAQESLFTRNLIVVAGGAELNFAEEFVGADSKAGLAPFSVAYTDIFVEKGATLRYSSAESWNQNTNHFHRYNIILEKDANMQFNTLRIGGHKSQVRLEVELRGEGAEFKARGAAQGDGAQHMDLVANFTHKGSHTKSSLDFWTVAAGQARVVFNGMIHVEKSALHTDAYQKSRSLLLSPKATVHSMPKLIIGTDEVACQHGASVSRIDPDQMFYLQSRGVDEDKATQIIVSGFTEPVLSALPTESLRSRMKEYLERKNLGRE